MECEERTGSYILPSRSMIYVEMKSCGFECEFFEG